MPRIISETNLQSIFKSLGSVERVVDDYFTSEGSFRSKYTTAWNDSAFSGDRDDSQNGQEFAYNIQGPDQGPTSRRNSEEGAQQFPRPPSRTNNTTPLNGLTDYAAQNAGVQPSLAQQEEDNLQRAIEASRRDVAGLPELDYQDQQEAGVLGADGTAQPQFGPATRPHYDLESWSLVQLSDHAVPASQRKRQPEAPAFIRGGVLGGYLTILHSIPTARNLLLKKGEEPQTCAHYPQWWNGQWENSSPVEDFKECDVDSPSFIEIELELKRLMAFLDDTERSYASCEKISEHLGSAVFGEFNSVTESFNSYLNWGNEDTDIKEKFCSTIESRLPDGEVLGRSKWSSLVARNVRDDSLSLSTLYELIDTILWENLYENDRRGVTSVLAETADVFTISVNSDTNAGIVQIPEEFYPERWLDSRFEEALKIQKGLRGARKSYLEASKARMNLPTFHDPVAGTRVRKREYLEKTEGRLQAYKDYVEGRARFRTVANSDYEVDRYPDYRLAEFELTAEETTLHDRVARAAEYCKSAVEHHGSQTTAANLELERIRAKQKFLGRLLTEPNKLGRPKPMTCKKYTLRGIATDDAVYLRKEADGDLIELDDVQPTTESQWWRLAHDARSNPYPVTTELLSFDEMHSRVWTDSKQPMIVYSTDETTKEHREALPAALGRFIKVDNKAFRQELQQEETMERQGDMITMFDSTSPSKRKHRESIDSMASNRPSVGGSERDPFASDYSEADEPSQKRRSPHDDEASPPLPQRPGSAQPMELTMPVIDGVEPAEEEPVTEIHVDEKTIQSTNSKPPEMQERQQPGTVTQFLSTDGDKTPAGGQQDQVRMDLL
ncbi:ubiquitin interaction motif protein [Emericellopsis cladophorae]|uniref:Ubiquitin interaction motif protein n=1 Tax=Emericellopsis cladophorae TaxID=2686198 RepID=A0A9P9XUK1_9HYPO|nr:ubiquitin interaction motif protein [Emericellopsis cladophorae]KAI6777689.1 ubiquitin interaction motif protein [Emericellopsis cladophorae]